MVNYVMKAHTGHIKLAGSAFMVYANRYQKAALACITAADPMDGFDPVPYYLFCLAIELHLKSFIWLKKGTEPNSLKIKYGHDIEKLWRDSKDCGIARYVHITSRRDHVIALVSPYYKKRQFNYLDIEMVLGGFKSIKLERQALPTLARLTDRLGKTLRRPILENS